MKTLIKTLAFACLTLGLSGYALAADAEKPTKEEKQAAEMNHIAMKDGKLWVMKDGKTMELKEEATLMDGTKVMTDGSYLEKDAKEKKMLKEGEAITWEGKVKDHAKLMKSIEKKQEKEKEAK
ncbi:DUF6799 domain-containing protein [Brevifollis gellanilyticus]|uniref:DUF6799 domain-containing protein n=1 Tax=Brevifollis gellanilyticus TaxID=748831 RepID=A0A512M3S8_9BACT|nr:DUF6799 domain-containing protein [Brevifollis gellanilyticus]GEP41368.1 hypothetical protein BGE01nite_06590 [Brevifollis gellanilyticus]